MHTPAHIFPHDMDNDNDQRFANKREKNNPFDDSHYHHANALSREVSTEK